MIVGIAGKKNSGKTTVASELMRYHGYTERAFADPLKEACMAIFHLNHEQMYGDQKEVEDPRLGVTPRHVLQFVGTNMFRNTKIPGLRVDSTRLWVWNFKQWYAKQPAGTRVVLSDVRFEEEADAINALGGIVIRIDRIGCDGDQHESENIDFAVDYAVNNDGSMEQLFESVHEKLKTHVQVE